MQPWLAWICCVSEDDLELLVLLPLPPKFKVDRCTSACLACSPFIHRHQEVKPLGSGGFILRLLVTMA